LGKMTQILILTFLTIYVIRAKISLPTAW